MAKDLRKHNVNFVSFVSVCYVCSQPAGQCCWVMPARPKPGLSRQPASQPGPARQPARASRQPAGQGLARHKKEMSSGQVTESHDWQVTCGVTW